MRASILESQCEQGQPTHSTLGLSERCFTVSVFSDGKSERFGARYYLNPVIMRLKFASIGTAAAGDMPGGTGANFIPIGSQFGAILAGGGTDDAANTF